MTAMRGRIYNFALRFLKNPEAAEDAMQEVFVKMIRHANQFQGDAKLSTWLFSITANWCRDYLRKADNKVKRPKTSSLRSRRRRNCCRTATSSGARTSFGSSAPCSH